YFITTFIADLGLSSPVDQKASNSNMYGVLSYTAPEVINRQPYTMASDIYSIGVLMSEISTGQQPFNDAPHDISLLMEIYRGSRPAFSSNTPRFYKELAYSC